MAIKVENSVSTAIAHSNVSGKLVKREANASQTKGTQADSGELRFRVKSSSDVLHPRTVGPARSSFVRSWTELCHERTNFVTKFARSWAASCRGAHATRTCAVMVSRKRSQGCKDTSTTRRTTNVLAASRLLSTAMYLSRTTSNVTGDGPRQE